MFCIFSRNALVGLPETQLATIIDADGTHCRLMKLFRIQYAVDMILTLR
jgi:enoyl-CoA hydratase/carnithine racemase